MSCQRNFQQSNSSSYARPRLDNGYFVLPQSRTRQNAGDANYLVSDDANRLVHEDANHLVSDDANHLVREDANHLSADNDDRSANTPSSPRVVLSSDSEDDVGLDAEAEESDRDGPSAFNAVRDARVPSFNLLIEKQNQQTAPPKPSPSRASVVIPCDDSFKMIVSP